MRHMAIGGLSALLLLVGCAHERPVAQRPATAPAAPQSQGSAQKAQAPATEPAHQSAASPAAGTAAPGAAAAEAEHAPVAAAAPSSRGGAAGSAAAAASGSAKTKPPGRGESPAAAAPPAAVADRAAPGKTAAGTAARPAAPTAPALDLPSLEQRLRDTHAIGVFSKLSLKNQVDDLLGEFRAFHHGQRALRLADLRQKYDLLLLKVLSLLQDGDPPLAAAISSSREAIWEILSDPQKFEKLARL